MPRAYVKITGMPHITEAEVEPESNTVIINGTIFHAEKLMWEVPVSGTVYGVLLNYKGAYDQYRDRMNHLPYKEPPKAPVLYIKPANTFNVNGGSIPLPHDVREVQAGAALGVVFGKTATKVCEQNALDYVAGFTVVNDVSIPHESIYRFAIKERLRDGFSPIGPWIITKEAVRDPDALNIQVKINGQIVQKNNTENLVRPIPKLIADITEFMTFHPGDVLMAGVPEHAPVISIGDHVEIEIERIGRLENTIISESEWVKGALR